MAGGHLWDSLLGGRLGRGPRTDHLRGKQIWEFGPARHGLRHTLGPARGLESLMAPPPEPPDVSRRHGGFFARRTRDDDSTNRARRGYLRANGADRRDRRRTVLRAALHAR